MTGGRSVVAGAFACVTMPLVKGDVGELVTLLTARAGGAQTDGLVVMSVTFM